MRTTVTLDDDLFATLQQLATEGSTAVEDVLAAFAVVDGVLAAPAATSPFCSDLSRFPGVRWLDPLCA